MNGTRSGTDSGLTRQRNVVVACRCQSHVIRSHLDLGKLIFQQRRQRRQRVTATAEAGAAALPEPLLRGGAEAAQPRDEHCPDARRAGQSDQALRPGPVGGRENGEERETVAVVRPGGGHRYQPARPPGPQVLSLALVVKRSGRHVVTFLDVVSEGLGHAGGDLS